MKYILVLCDGMGDYPVPELSGKTPLEYARTPNMDKLAKTARIGLVKTVPNGFTPGSDVANLGVLGFDVRKCYTGRSPLEALSMGVEMHENEIAMRTNLVTLSKDEPFENKIMKDYSAGEISDEEASVLMAAIKAELSTDKFVFYKGVSYRHCLIVKDALPNEDLTPPHDISGRRIGEYLPKGALGKQLEALIRKSYEILSVHPINVEREKQGKNPANSIWFWGEGTKPSIPSFQSQYGKTGTMISAVDLLKGIAVGSGMQNVSVQGATGTIGTNFLGKAQAAIDALESGRDFCMIHLEATDECGHQRDPKGKAKSIELIDEKVIGTLVNHFEKSGEDYALLVMPDHYTPVSLGKHTSEPVPFMLYASNKALSKGEVYDEKHATASGDYIADSRDLTDCFLSLN